MHRIFLEGYKRLETVTASGENLVTESQHDKETYLFFFFFWPCWVACGILVPQPSPTKD